MKTWKIILLFVAAAVASIILFSCKKENLKPTLPLPPAQTQEMVKLDVLTKVQATTEQETENLKTYVQITSFDTLTQTFLYQLDTVIYGGGQVHLTKDVAKGKFLYVGVVTESNLSTPISHKVESTFKVGNNVELYKNSAYSFNHSFDYHKQW